MRRIAFSISSKEEEKLIKDADQLAAENFMSRSRFIKLAMRMYINYLKNHDKLT